MIACTATSATTAQTVDCHLANAQWGTVTWWLKGPYGKNPVTPPYTSTTWTAQGGASTGGAGTYIVTVTEVSGSSSLTSGDWQIIVSAAP
jgi:hypothetical protein